MRFSRDKWYSNEGQRLLQRRARQQSLGLRQVISLGLLLLLVLLLMRQLQDPSRYEPTFRAIGLTQPAQPNQPALVSRQDSNGEPERNRLSAGREIGEDTLSPLRFAAASETIDLYAQIWSRLMESASVQVIDTLARTEFTEEAPVSLRDPHVALWLDEAQKRVDRWREAYRSSEAKEATQRKSDEEIGEAFVGQWQAWSALQREGMSMASMALDPELKSGLRLALDRKLLSFVRDATPWRPQERPPLARTLQRGRLLAEQSQFDGELFHSTPLIEAPLLMKQADVYRGETVRLRGWPVTQPDPISIEFDGWGKFHYDLVWFRPTDGSRQPICVYALKPPNGGWPSHLAKLGTPLPYDAFEGKEGTLAEITGILIKRFVYPTQQGVEVAPTLVASSVRWLTSEELDAPSVRSNRLSSIESRRWSEPGEQAENLQILRDILESDLRSLSESNLWETLTDAAREENLDESFPQLGQVLYQLPRLEKPLRAAMVTKQEIGGAKLDEFRGWVREAKAISLPKTFSASGTPTVVYRLRLEGGGSSDEHAAAGWEYAIVNQIPSAWKKEDELAQPIVIEGLCLIPDNDSSGRKLWLANQARWSWHWLDEAASTKFRQQPAIPDDWAALGKAGYDLSQADLLANLRGKSLTAQESSAFYSLMDCVERLSDGMLPPSKGSLSAIDTLRQDDPPLLRRIHARVHVVRATRIRLTDPAEQDSLGSDGYYELDGLALLGDRLIELTGVDDAEKLIFQGEYPITLIAKSIPGWLMEPGANVVTSPDDPTGDSDASMVWYPRRTAEVDGFFYRLWSFHTAQTSALERSSEKGAEAAKLRQIGPLVAVARWEKPLDQDTSAPDRSVWRELLTATGLAAIGLYLLYRWNQTAKRRKP